MLRIAFSIASSFLLFFSLNVFAHETNKDFDSAIKHKSFHIPVSHKNLSELHEATTLLVSCVDFRLRDETEILMRKYLKLLDQYDELVLPGASIAMVNTKYPHWSKTGKEIIGLLKPLHKIKRVIFLDHRGCAAFSLILGKDATNTKEKETAVHKKTLEEATALIKKEFPDLEVYSLLMGLDGEVENLTPMTTNRKKR